MSDLTKRLRSAEKDDRLSTGALYGESADRIERLEAALRMCCDTGEMAVRNKYDYGGFRRAVETARALLAEAK